MWRKMSWFSLLLQLLGVYFFRGMCTGSCFPGMVSPNIGSISPMEFVALEAGSTVIMNCSLEPGFAQNNSLTARDIFWVAGSSHEALSLKNDPRITFSVVENLTASLSIRNFTVSDSGDYVCNVHTEHDPKVPNRKICSVSVPFGGLPKKYKDFECVTENWERLTCSWSGDDEESSGVPKTKFTLKYRTTATPSSMFFDCPNLTVPKPNMPRKYKCEWNMTMGFNTPKDPNLPEGPKFLVYYNHILAITGKNDVGSETWLESIDLKEHVRPAAPLELKVIMYDSHTCSLTWKVASNLEGQFMRQVGLLFEVEYRKNETRPGKNETRPCKNEEPAWNVTATNVEELQHEIYRLDAFATYDIRIRGKPKTNGYWSDYATTTCQTAQAKPEGNPGMVPGAFEESGMGFQRMITVYWKGIPNNMQNGPNFRYEVYGWLPGQLREMLGSSKYANFRLPDPVSSNSSLMVEVVPSNAIGDFRCNATTLIPIVRDSPLLITYAVVAQFTSEVYEISWELNQPADVIDVFWCRTSLEPHFNAKCTDNMDNKTLSGNLTAHNLTVDGNHRYRFAVAARSQGDQLLSGMKWISRYCTPEEPYLILTGLTVTPDVNATMKIKWDKPCQARFLPIKGYRIEYYPCDVDSQYACGTEKREWHEINRTTTSITGLQPEKRYCFELNVLFAAGVVEKPGYKQGIQQCRTTSGLVPPLPLPGIVGGAIAGAILLVIVAFTVWRFIKKCRSGFRVLKLKSHKIVLPPAQLKNNGNGDYNPQSTYYTTIDLDEKSKSYARQLSGHSGSSSGHGSCASDHTALSSQRSGDDVDLIVKLKLKSDVMGKKAATFDHARHGSVTANKFRHHSTVELGSVPYRMHSQSDSAETVSLDGSLNLKSSPGKPRSPSRKSGSFSTSGRIPSRQPSPHVSGGSSGTTNTDLTTSTGGSGIDDQSSFGYVVAPSTQPSFSAQSSNANTGDTGYTSHPSTSSESHDDDSGNATGGSRDFYPLVLSRPKPPPIDTKIPYRVPIIDSGQARFPESDDENRSGSDSGQSSPIIASTHLLGNGKLQKDQLTGYVKWP